MGYFTSFAFNFDYIPLIAILRIRYPPNQIRKHRERDIMFSTLQILHYLLSAVSLRMGTPRSRNSISADNHISNRDTFGRQYITKLANSCREHTNKMRVVWLPVNLNGHRYIFLKSANVSQDSLHPMFQGALIHLLGDHHLSYFRTAHTISFQLLLQTAMIRFVIRTNRRIEIARQQLTLHWLNESQEIHSQEVSGALETVEPT